MSAITNTPDLLQLVLLKDEPRPAAGRCRVMDTRHRPTKQKARRDLSAAGQHERFLQLTWTNSKAKLMIAPVTACHNGDAVPHKALQTGLATRTTVGAASRAPHHCDSGFFYVHVLRMATRNAQIQPHAQRVRCKVWQSVWDTREGVPVPTAGSLTRTDCRPYLAMRTADSTICPVGANMADFSAITVRTAPAHTLPTYRDTPAHVDNFNRDVIAVGNAENAIARVLFELRKPQPDNARALKLAQAALMAVQYVGVGVQ